MGIIFVLLPLSIVLALIFLLAYLWSVRTDQFEDLETPAMRILFEEDALDGHEQRGKERNSGEAVYKK